MVDRDLAVNNFKNGDVRKVLSLSKSLPGLFSQKKLLGSPSGKGLFILILISRISLRFCCVVASPRSRRVKRNDLRLSSIIKFCAVFSRATDRALSSHEPP